MPDAGKIDTSTDLARQMQGCIGRYTEKTFDWDAFPGSRGFPDLQRAQLRYVGAGGSPKSDDPSTLKAEPGALRTRLALIDGRSGQGCVVAVAHPQSLGGRS